MDPLSPQNPLRRIEGRIRPDLRRAVVFGALALVALVVGRDFNRRSEHSFVYASYGLAAAVLVFGVLATRTAANEVNRVAQLRAGSAAASPLRILIQIVGYVITVLAVLEVLKVDLSQFLVGGAVTGIVIGIAAQQSLGNFFAGLVLLLARPYTAGQYVTVYSGSINGPHHGVVDEVALLYTTITTATGPLKIPNSVLLASGVAPADEPPPAAPSSPTSPPSSPPAAPPAPSSPPAQPPSPSAPGR